mmetsp:Transcript_7755/g.22083  ORF Transcript_7755/g.22083 Transcript_7755/m.22083 type:complete len:370 (+) Transcript_7755:1290-2399(+)
MWSSVMTRPTFFRAFMSFLSIDLTAKQCPVSLSSISRTVPEAPEPRCLTSLKSPSARAPVACCASSISWHPLSLLVWARALTTPDILSSTLKGSGSPASLPSTSLMAMLIISWSTPSCSSLPWEMSTRTATRKRHTPPASFMGLRWRWLSNVSPLLRKLVNRRVLSMFDSTAVRSTSAALLSCLGPRRKDGPRPRMSSIGKPIILHKASAAKTMGQPSSAGSHTANACSILSTVDARSIATRGTRCALTTRTLSPEEFFPLEGFPLDMDLCRCWLKRLMNPDLCGWSAEAAATAPSTSSTGFTTSSAACRRCNTSAIAWQPAESGMELSGAVQPCLPKASPARMAWETSLTALFAAATATAIAAGSYSR